MDSAGAGAPPNSVYAVMRVFLDEWRDRGENWESWLMDIVRARKLFGELVRAHADDIACIPNVSSGLGAVASSLQFKPDGNVVVSELNFPTNVYLWHALRQRGSLREVRLLRATGGEVPISEYEQAIDDSTAAVSVDYVSWINGCRERVEQVAKLAHEHRALMVVDAFHATGVIPIDVGKLGADVLLCGTYKWLLGPHGAAFLYIRPDALKELNPSIIGWHGIKDSVIARLRAEENPFGRPFNLNQAEPAENASRFEWGTWSVVSVEGAKAALEFTRKYPPEDRWPLIQRLNEKLRDKLHRKGKHVTSPDGKDRQSGILTFETAEATQVAARLQAEHIVVAPRVNTLRISPHFYNTEEEIDLLVERL